MDLGKEIFLSSLSPVIAFLKAVREAAVMGSSQPNTLPSSEHKPLITSLTLFLAAVGK
jgi:hypothetical protein